jgi:LuxR family maltose regulon positive regulatory protein
MDIARTAQIDGTGAFGQILAESAEAILDLIAGRLKQASSRMQMANDNFAAGRSNDQIGNPLAAIEFAEMRYEAGDIETAEKLLLVYCPLVRDLGPTDALISSHVLLARIINTRGERDRALNILNELENCGHRLKLPRAVASARLERAIHCLTRKDNSNAAQQLALAEQTINWPEVEGRWYIANDILNPTTVRFSWLIACGKHKEAIPAIKEAIDTADNKGRERRALKMRILLAKALYAEGEGKRALRTLSHAVDIASAEGFVQTFLEEGSSVITMLKELKAETGTSLDNNWFSQLVKTPQQSSEVAQPTTLIEPLTPKEMNVLQLLAQGNSNNDMADALYVSESTVRTHLRNINLKLQAKNRTQAIALARELGLIQ